MTDPRWSDIDPDVQAAIRRLGRAVALCGASPLDGDDAYVARMAFMHAMQSGHTCIKTILLRVLDLLAEQRPTGEQPASNGAPT